MFPKSDAEQSATSGQPNAQSQALEQREEQKVDEIEEGPSCTPLFKAEARCRDLETLILEGCDICNRDITYLV